MDIFVFGTLRSDTLRKIVLGRDMSPDDICMATIKDFRVYWAKEGPFPVMIPEANSQAHGLVLNNLSETDVERLNYYELGFDYVLDQAWVKTDAGLIEVSAYFCNRSNMATAKLWSFDEWLSDHSEIQYLAAREFLDFFGTKFGETAQLMYNSILKRAEVFFSESSAPTNALEIGPDMYANIQVKELKREYLGFFALNHVDLKYPFFNKSTSGIKSRTY